MVSRRLTAGSALLVAALVAAVPSVARPGGVGYVAAVSSESGSTVRDPAVRRPAGESTRPVAEARAAVASGDVDVSDLHSDPGSDHTILLEFDPVEVSGTAWNEQYGVQPGTYGGDITNLTDADEYEIWQRVSEDYAPFDVDVTTENIGTPSLDDPRLDPDDSTPDTFGTMVLITGAGASQAICPPTDGSDGCGGIAYQNAFAATNHHDLQPAWVFDEWLGDPHTNDPDPKVIAEAAAHEAGHTFGLVHDNYTLDDGDVVYYDGSLQRTEGWAPIMGAGYYEPVTQWADLDFGSYPDAHFGDTGANAPQQHGGSSCNDHDDICIVAHVLGTGSSGYRADEDPGASLSNLAAAPAPPPASDPTAYITTHDDVDYYDLGTCSGRVEVQGDPAPVGPDLDMKLTLYNASQQQVASDDEPFTRVSDDVAGGLGADVVDADAPAAHYYVAVDGVGMLGHTNADDGYDDYGSVGAYTLHVGGCESDDAPTAVQGLRTTLNGTTATLAWTAPASPGDSALTGYRVTVNGVTTTLGPAATTFTAANLRRGATTTFTVTPENATHLGPVSTSRVAPPLLLPGAPRIGAAASGTRGGKVTATARWAAPVSDGGAAVAGYRVLVYRLDAHGQVAGTSRISVGAAVRAVVITFGRHAAGRYRFAVQARNAKGYGPLSARSAAVQAR